VRLVKDVVLLSIGAVMLSAVFIFPFLSGFSFVSEMYERVGACDFEEKWFQYSYPFLLSGLLGLFIIRKEKIFRFLALSLLVFFVLKFLQGFGLTELFQIKRFECNRFDFFLVLINGLVIFKAAAVTISRKTKWSVLLIAALLVLTARALPYSERIFDEGIQCYKNGFPIFEEVARTSTGRVYLHQDSETTYYAGPSDLNLALSNGGFFQMTNMELNKLSSSADPSMVYRFAELTATTDFVFQTNTPDSELRAGYLANDARFELIGIQEKGLINGYAEKALWFRAVNVSSRLMDNGILVEEGPHYYRFDVAGSGGPELIRISYFPYWHAYLDSSEVEIESDRYGLMEIDIPSGNHVLELKFVTGVFFRLSAAASLLFVLFSVVFLSHKH